MKKSMVEWAIMTVMLLLMTLIIIPEPTRADTLSSCNNYNGALITQAPKTSNWVDKSGSPGKWVEDNVYINDKNRVSSYIPLTSFDYMDLSNPGQQAFAAKTIGIITDKNPQFYWYFGEVFTRNGVLNFKTTQYRYGQWYCHYPPPYQMNMHDKGDWGKGYGYEGTSEPHICDYEKHTTTVTDLTSIMGIQSTDNLGGLKYSNIYMSARAIKTGSVYDFYNSMILWYGASTLYSYDKNIPTSIQRSTGGCIYAIGIYYFKMRYGEAFDYSVKMALQENSNKQFNSVAYLCERSDSNLKIPTGDCRYCNVGRIGISYGGSHADDEGSVWEDDPSHIIIDRGNYGWTSNGAYVSLSGAMHINSASYPQMWQYDEFPWAQSRPGQTSQSGYGGSGIVTITVQYTKWMPYLGGYFWTNCTNLVQLNYTRYGNDEYEDIWTIQDWGHTHVFSSSWYYGTTTIGVYIPWGQMALLTGALKEFRFIVTYDSTSSQANHYHFSINYRETGG